MNMPWFCRKPSSRGCSSLFERSTMGRWLRQKTGGSDGRFSIQNSRLRMVRWKEKSSELYQARKREQYLERKYHITKDDIMNRQKRKALIIGCGVAGPVVALFLQRAGIEAEIYEARAESTDYGGSFLNMACNGVGVLKTLGLDDQVSSQGSPIPRMIIWNGKGKRLGEVHNGARAEVGAPSINILRSRLHQALREGAERRRIKMAFGKKLAGLSTGEQGVIATFEDGTTAEGSFLVGCD